MRINTVLLAALLASFITPGQAASIALAADGQWQGFAVDELLAPVANPLAWIDDQGDLLAFTFTITPGQVGHLTVIDAGYAGDQFALNLNGAFLGNTSAVASADYDSNNLPSALDYAMAYTDPSYSKALFTLAAGSYSLSGTLLQSATIDGGTTLNATSGAVKLDVAPVPTPPVLISIASGLAAWGFSIRRRQPN